MTVIQSDICSAIQFATEFHRNCRLHQRLLLPNSVVMFRRSLLYKSLTIASGLGIIRAFSTNETEDSSLTSSVEVTNKPPICTADELHYVSVDKSQWRLALWRYKPSSQAPKRNHPLLLLSGVGTNAIGYDLSPESSFARCMCEQGFDTWILEVRGAGLSMWESDTKDIEKSAHEISAKMEAATDNATNGAISMKGQPTDAQNSSAEPEVPVLHEELMGMATAWDESILVTKLTETFTRSVSPQLNDLLARLTTTLQDFQKQLDLIVKYDWDFDHYLEEDVPAVMEYIRAQTEPKDGKLLAIGHSMGGILLYAMLSRYAYEGKESGLAAVVTLASSLDYTSSKSALKLLVPLADPAQALNVPVVPLGALLSAVYSISSRPPYVLSWLNDMISAQDMMHPELLKKLVLNNFCTIPAKLILQLTTSFKEGGLRDRSGNFFYKDSINKTNVPVLAIAGDRDIICPPEAVYDTVKLLPEHLVTYKVFGEQDGPHYAHYDLVGGRMAITQLYPCIIQFLSKHD